MFRAKRGDQVPPPPDEGEWDLRFATKESLSFADLEKQFPGNCDEAKARLRTAPTTRSSVQKPLKGSLGRRQVRGRWLDQWQYDIASGARLWYCPDPVAKIVWLTLASLGHPRATETKQRRGPRNR